MTQTPQPQPIQIDPARAFQALKRTSAEQIATLIGDCAAKDAAIEQLVEEINTLRTQMDAVAEKTSPATPLTPAAPISTAAENGHTPVAEVVDIK
jgi:hypothetical protein